MVTDRESARQALAQTRKRCWKYAWVVEIDIKGFFDNIDWELLLRAVRRHISERWVVMYIERWLKAPVQMPDGEVQLRTRGTPQAGWSARSSPICFCTMPSTNGCSDIMRIYHLNGMPTMRCATVTASPVPECLLTSPGPFCAMWAGAASAEDAGCLLQGCRPTGRLP